MRHAAECSLQRGGEEKRNRNLIINNLTPISILARGAKYFNCQMRCRQTIEAAPQECGILRVCAA